MAAKPQSKIIFLFVLLGCSLAFAQPQSTGEGLLKVTIDRFEGGQNSADLSDIINPNQGESFKNVVINRKGKISKRKGQALFAGDQSNVAFTGLSRFDPDQNTHYLITASGTLIQRTTISSASWVTANPKNALTTGKDTDFIQANDLIFILNGTNNTANYDGSSWDPGSSSTASPPIGTTGAWQLNYFFVAGNPTNTDWIYFSNNLAPTLFTAADIIKVNTGDGQKIVKLLSFKLNELIVYKDRSIFDLDLSGTTPLTDWTVQPITKSIGCVAPRSVVNIGNDHWFLSNDPIAVRSVARTQFDKLFVSMVSTPIQDIFDGTGSLTINRTQIDKAAGVFFDDKYILAIATGTSTANNTVVVFDFITKSWYVIDKWFVADWQTIDNELYSIDSFDGRAIKCFTGTTGDMASGPVVTSASEPTQGISFEYVTKNIDFDNSENFKQLDSVELEFESAGAFDATVFINIDDEGFQTLGTVDLSGGAITLPVNLPFTLIAGGVVRSTLHAQRFGEFRRIKVKVTQDVKDETIDLKRVTCFAKMKRWRRE